MEICAIGGFNEVGKNMTAVKTGEDVFIFDCGFFLPGIIELQETEKIGYSLPGLRRVGGIPDERILDTLQWRNKVRGIFLSHAHLDHIGGLAFLINRYPNVDIFGTPFTIEVLKSLIEDSKIKVSNKIRVVNPDSIHKIKTSDGEVEVEFVRTTHSTIDCSFLALHSKEGTFFYALDLKFDNHPTMGEAPNYKRLKEIGSKKVKALIIDALYSYTEKRPGGEKVAENLLEEAFSKINRGDKALFVTTFSSHIERLNNIVKIGKKTNREIIFLGRSLAKYVSCAMQIGKCPFKNKIQMVKYRGQVQAALKKVEANRGKYLVVCTGHQGEENSILDRISKGETPFKFREEDNIIFSSSVIPTEVNLESRKKMDSKLRKMGVKLQVDIHVHGHGSREDMRELIRLLKPEHIIPAHGSQDQEKPLIELSEEFNYVREKTAHLMKNGDVLKI
ncbi:ribonuclease J [Candidatus Pacearchaeota archaeon CG10_big_fil_rev_8_21_14_0_10_32_42]|nr:MAG: ribonuclease J [Candidatus Pacearchaeota archaeon CG10_big_fil_rev_8_21_14_0_10_32_42]